ncbi:MAG TPA: sugar transferase [Myxococcales bacterium]|jgi:lipopolysaccharide/colanic/teichoic acid biosynthesis glycosyltransferase
MNQKKTPGKLVRLAKRGLDLAGVLGGGLLLSPVMLGTSLALLATQGRPVFFRQTRPGLGGRPFRIIKFRTMTAPRPDQVWYLTDEQRTTRLGRFLRRTSLDELPELWNVLRGEMSLVGPRPLLVEYLDQYSPEEARRHDVPPGITGWAAINGRHTKKFRERLALDVWYVDHWSFWLDLEILARTVYQVLRREDVRDTQGIDEIGFPLPKAPPRTEPAASAGEDGARSTP